MKALIVEDEKMAQANLARLIEENFCDITITGQTGSVRDTVEWLNTPGNKADIIFMDVELSDGNCFEIFRQTDIRAKVIMTTAYDRYAIKAFEAGSIDYLLKPVDLADLKRAVSRCHDSIYMSDLKILLDSFNKGKQYKERFIIRFNETIVPVKTSEIAYFYAEDRANYLVTFNNDKYLVDNTLDEIFEDLDPDEFFRISRSCIISSAAIKSVAKKINGNIKISAQPESSFNMMVSRMNVKDFMKWLSK